MVLVRRSVDHGQNYATGPFNAAGKNCTKGLNLMVFEKFLLGQGQRVAPSNYGSKNVRML